tara:strand:- start:937 stop:1947 length:1011 start_codon:yes stop_codon:yes gene_type:complete
MKAIQCKELSEPDNWNTTIEFNDIEDPEFNDDQVLIEIKVASVNFPDVLMVQGKYQFQPPMPFIPGAEASGVIVGVGSNIKDFNMGDKVFVMSGNGCFAEKLAVDPVRVQKIPNEMDFNVAAALAMTYGTSLYALKQRASLKEGETLLVLGAAGGVGLSAVEIGKAMGARVIAAASSEEKVKVCLEHGADETIVYSDCLSDKTNQKEFSNKIKELTSGQGANVIYDPVGGNYSEPAIRATAWEGRYLVIGFATGEIPQPPLNLALLKGCQIVGVFWGAWATIFPDQNEKNFLELFEMYSKKQINPRIEHTYDLSKAVDAIKLLANRKATGKVIIEI